ncbi:SET domain-containing protein [Massarina eburnea CBS 473.64]|uniref:SET domain-containing protein n=1 Tax=Massarina eburnea CBS 473.64 TaxID=1395130 RepID=A0A6A6S8T0_9PLEO|nr:SET domain-containing protein [Massarina eburnea CBS 473.64]
MYVGSPVAALDRWLLDVVGLNECEQIRGSVCWNLGGDVAVSCSAGEWLEVDADTNSLPSPLENSSTSTRHRLHVPPPALTSRSSSSSRRAIRLPVASFLPGGIPHPSSTYQITLSALSSATRRRPCCQASIAPRRGDVMQQPSHAASIQPLVTWFTEHEGVLNPDVEIAHEDSNGFHMRAIRPLTSPAIVTCPLKLTISHLNLVRSQSVVPCIDSPLQRCVGEIPDKILTYLLLVEQRCLAKEGKSAWQAYFDCLPGPAEMTTTLWFDERDLDFLRGTDLYRATYEKKDDLVKEYEDTVAVLTRLGIKPEQDRLNYELYLWAFTIMSSRSFVSTYMLPKMKTFPILFPVIDILNHTATAKVDWAFQDDSFTVALVEQNTVSAGDQIFNNYAPKQNGELLLGYGFAIPDNPIEQFAIKMALPPDMIEAAKELGFYNGENVPFGMPQSILEDNASAEEQFLRPRDHIFGRYENNIPWLRGIPPWVVHAAFVAICMQLGHTPSEINAHRPCGIIVLQVLSQLYEAVRMKSLSLANPAEQLLEPANVKQRYATIYRDGQAKIIDHIRTELETIISNLRIYKDELSPPGPVIVTTSETLRVLKEQHPSYFSEFQKGLKQHFDIDISESYTEQIKGQEQEVWTILIFVLTYITLTTENPKGLLHDWVLEWLEIHTLPSVAALPPSDPNGFDETLLGSFVYNSPEPVSVLNNIQSTYDQPILDARFGDLPVWDDDDDAGLDRLGDKVLAWASEVVDMYGTKLYGHEDRDAGRVGMYMRPYSETEPVEEKWIYEDVYILF